MKNSTRKVVILDNITSPYIQQAIIVLNEKAVLSESKVISDAERIVNEYLKRNGYCGNDTTKVYENKQNKKNKSRYGFFATVLIAFSIAVYFVINR